MKSIKEKAIEVFPRHCNANTDLSNFKKRIGFSRGANYVLEEIERIVNSAIENKSMTIPTWRLNYIIKQLRK